MIEHKHKNNIIYECCECKFPVDKTGESCYNQSVLNRERCPSGLWSWS